ncbi:MAG: hypothetical protein IKT09_05110 [Synergistes sp.]|nr:hypothetical protein [Synergistes sp.]
MLKDIMQLLFGDKRFGDRSGVYLYCGYRRRTKRIGEANSVERHAALSTQLREMDCWGCRLHGKGCHGPMKEIRTA